MATIEGVEGLETLGLSMYADDDDCAERCVDRLVDY